MRPALQLYSVRDFDEPLTTTLRRVAAAGFEGVEFAKRVKEADPAEVAATLEQTGLVPLAAHVEYRDLTGPDLEELLARYVVIGCRRLVVPHVPAWRFRSDRQLRAFAAELKALQATLAEHGFELWYHNQDHEFAPLVSGPLAAVLESSVVPSPATTVGTSLLRRLSPTVNVDRTGYGAFVKELGGDVGFEVDTGHLARVGYDPVAVIGAVADLGGSVRSVHLTDQTFEHAGKGVVPAPELLARIERAGEAAGAEWLVYEEDEPESPMAALERATDLLINRGATADTDDAPTAEAA